MSALPFPVQPVVPTGELGRITAWLRSSKLQLADAWTKSWAARVLEEPSATLHQGLPRVLYLCAALHCGMAAGCLSNCWKVAQGLAHRVSLGASSKLGVHMILAGTSHAVQQARPPSILKQRAEDARCRVPRSMMKPVPALLWAQLPGGTLRMQLRW